MEKSDRTGKIVFSHTSVKSTLIRKEGLRNRNTAARTVQEITRQFQAARPYATVWCRKLSSRFLIIILYVEIKRRIYSLILGVLKCSESPGADK